MIQDKQSFISNCFKQSQIRRDQREFREFDYPKSKDPSIGMFSKLQIQLERPGVI